VKGTCKREEAFALRKRARRPEDRRMGRFLLGVLVGIVIIVVALVQCTRAIF
jgi:hypothetical protein